MCDGCGHDYHGLTECGHVALDNDDSMHTDSGCPCIGDESQAKEVWESQAADERWADRFERD